MTILYCIKSCLTWHDLGPIVPGKVNGLNTLLGFLLHSSMLNSRGTNDPLTVKPNLLNRLNLDETATVTIFMSSISEQRRIG